jgi:plasmid maintenance system killer protein
MGQIPLRAEELQVAWLTKANSLLDELKITLRDLLIPPGNQFEALGRDRRGQFSIRINQRYRICFIWTGRGPAQVEIVDYH